ncbi:MAG: PAS domain S-box protein [Melioribacteraceae bacterium]|nr:PAS domain S-box protein [Melioribacteraceae bacterium]MCF8356331.1 PAS domain S-box protein [Melioribacteraceae bacterium]MCF8395732.1 PAS domain S-box protein [Melioribacteraceae bacterium]MCF8420883.1 PAS domain S-box protein [Melioribacteraceae bacterium]
MKRKSGSKTSSGKGRPNYEKEINKIQLEFNALKNIERIYNKISENTKEVIYHYSSKSGGAFYSSNTKSLLGFSTKQLEANPKLWYQSIHEDDIDFVMDSLKKLKTNKVADIEYRFIKPSGKLIWLRDRFICVKRTKDEVMVHGIATDVTESKKVQMSLEKKETDYALLFEHAADAILIGKKNGIITEVNKTFLKLTGYKKAELIGKKIETLFDKSELKLNPLQYDKVYSGYEVLKERQLRKRNGKQIPVEMKSKILVDGRLISFIRDISERYEHQKLLKESEERFQTIFKKDKTVKLLIDPSTGLIVDANNAAAEYYGYSLESLKEKKIQQINQLPVKEVKERMQLAAKQNKNYFLFKHKLANGKIRDVEVHSTPLYLKDRQYLFSIIHDVTEKTQAEKALEESEKTYRSLIDEVIVSSSAAIFIFDADFKIVWINHTSEKFFGLKKDRVIGKSKKELIKTQLIRSFEKPEEFLKKVQSAYDKNEYIKGYEVKIPARGRRKERWLALWSKPIQKGLYKGGRIEHFTDITELKASEIALEKKNAELAVIYDLSPVMTCLLDEKRNIIYANKAFSDFTGTSQEDLQKGKACGVIGCVNAFDDPRGCGYGDKCADCNLRKALLETVLSMKNQKNIEYSPTVIKNGRKKQVYFIGATALIEAANKKNVLLTLHNITEQKIIENKLKESEEKYRLLVENQSDLIVKVDLDGKFEFVSRSYCELFDKKEEDLLGNDFLPIVKPDDQKSKHLIIDKIIKPQQESQVEQYEKTKYGWKWINWNYTPLFDEFGNALSILAVGRDITERRAYEDTLMKFKNIVSSTEDAISLVDRNYKYIIVNKAYEKFSGTSKEKFIGKTVEEYLGKEAFEKNVKARFDRCLNGETVTYKEYFDFPTKGRRYVQVTYYPYKNKDGAIEGVVANTRDITESKLAAEALEESERFKSTLLGNLPGVIYRCNNDEHWTMLYMNEKVEELTGYSENDIINNKTISHNNIIYEKDRKKVNEYIRKQLETADQFDLEYRIQTKEKGVKWVWEKGTAFRNAAGEIKYLEGYITDINEKKSAQLAQEIQSQMLENMAEGTSLVSVNDGKIIYTNPSFNKIFKYDEGELIGKHISIINAETEESPEIVADKIINELRAKGVWTGEVLNIKKDGTKFYTFATISTFNHSELGELWVTAQSDITEIKKAEKLAVREKIRLELLHNLYTKTSNLDDKELYDFVIDRAVKLTESKIGFFHRLREDQKTIKLTTWSTETLKNCTAVYDDHYPIDKAGNWVDCLKQKKPVVYSDFKNSPNQKGLPEGHTVLKRFMSVPVIYKDNIKFIFGVGNKETNYDDNDVLQIQLIADELYKVLESRKANEELVKSNTRLKEAEHIGNMGYYYFDFPEGEVIWSDEAFRMLGRDKILGPPSIEEYYNYLHDEDREYLQTELEKAIIEKTPFDLVYRVIVNSKIKYLQNIGRPILNENNEVCAVTGIIKDITDYQNALNRIKENEERFEKAFLTSPDAVAVTRIRDGVYIDVNESFKRILGYEREEMIGKGSLELNIWKYEEDRKRLVKGLKENGYIENLDAEYLKKDGGVIYGLMSARIIKLSGEEVILSITRDITERKEIEKSLKESEARIKAILKTQPDLFFRINKELVFVDCFVNDESILLAPIDEIIGANCKDILPDYLYDLSKENVNMALITNEMQNYEYSVTVGGKEQWFDARMIPSAEDEVLVIVRNITDKKDSERALEESELKHRKLISNISDVIVIVNLEGIIKYKSSNIKQFFGWEPEDLIGKHALTTVHPDDKERVLKELNNLLAENASKTTLEFNYICKDGSIKPVELTGISLVDDPVIKGVVANYKDITERKKAEKVIVETQRLGAIGEMSSAIAHDFNNSLQSIFGNLELALVKIEEGHSSRKYLKTIKTAAADAATRIRLLQRFAGTSISQNEFEAVDVNEIIKDVIIQTRPVWKDNPQKDGLEITINKNLGTVPHIWGNNAELRSVLHNIVKNAVEAMPSGGRIFISTSQKDNDVHIEIRDEGEGMDEETKARIFQPFFTTKGFETGRGLGMSGAYSIIHEHDGEISIKESSKENGTTILIILPVKEIKKIEKNELSETDENSAIAKVLWVDDDEMIRDVAEGIIEVLGHEGRVVASGEEALKALHEDNYDLVISDVGMPGMNGWELARKINELVKSEISIALVTGWGDQIDEHKRIDHGVDFVFTKPIKIEQIKKIINDSIRLK